MNAFDYMAQALERAGHVPDKKERDKMTNARYYANNRERWALYQLIQRRIRTLTGIKTLLEQSPTNWGVL